MEPRIWISELEFSDGSKIILILIIFGMIHYYGTQIY